MFVCVRACLPACVCEESNGVFSDKQCIGGSAEPNYVFSDKQAMGSVESNGVKNCFQRQAMYRGGLQNSMVFSATIKLWGL